MGAALNGLKRHEEALAAYATGALTTSTRRTGERMPRCISHWAAPPRPRLPSGAQRSWAGRLAAIAACLPSTTPSCAWPRHAGSGRVGSSLRRSEQSIAS